MYWSARSFRLGEGAAPYTGSHALIQGAVIPCDSGINNLDLKLQGEAAVPDTCVPCTHREHQVSLP